MKTFKIISVCGSGTVSSSMVSSKIEAALEKEGIKLKAVEVNNGQIANTLATDNFDAICYASPITGTFDIPVVNAIGLLTGIGEEEILEEIVELAKNK
jgi:PTS system galactitol-specific IIB component